MQGAAHLYQAASGPGNASSGTVRLRSSGGKMGSAVGVFSAVPPYIASLSSLLVPLSAPAEQSQGWPVLGHTCRPATTCRSATTPGAGVARQQHQLVKQCRHSHCKLSYGARASPTPIMAYITGSA